MEDVKLNASRSFEQDIVKYSDFCDHVLAHQDDLAEWEDPDLGLQAALCATVDTLLSLYFLKDPDWDVLKFRMYISFVKATKSTITSVTSGIATSVLTPGQSVGFLNCRETIKYQFYKKDYLGIVRVVDEHIPVNEHSFSSLLLDDMSAETQLVESIREELERKERLDKTRTALKLKLIGVIGGPVRDAWEAGDQTSKSVLELRVRSILEPLGIQPWNEERDSYFMTTEEEAQLENLATVNLIKDVNPAHDVLLSLGIGRTNCQWATSKHSFMYEYGMNNPELLVGDPQHSLKAAVCGQVLTNMAMLKELSDDWDKPVIALKSGCLLSISKDKALKKIVVPKRRAEEDVTQVAFGKGQVLHCLVDGAPVWATVLDYDNETKLYTFSTPQVPKFQAPLPRVFSVRAPQQVFYAITSPEQTYDIKIETKMQQKSQIERPTLLKLLRAQHWKARSPAKYGVLYDNLSLIVDPPEVMLSVESGKAAKADIYDPSTRSIAGTAYWKTEETNKATGGINSRSLRLVFNQEFQEKLVTSDDRSPGKFLLRSHKGKVVQEAPVNIEPCLFPLFPEHQRISLIRDGQRVMATLDNISEQGEYLWRLDNSVTTFPWPVDQGENDPKEAQACSSFRYQKGTILLFWMTGVGWADASVVAHLGGNQHSLLVLVDGEPSRGTFDLNEFNHTWPNLAPQLGKAQDAALHAFNSYITHEEERFRYVEDAITCKKLEVKNQLLLIHTDQKQTSNSGSFPPINNVSGLVNLMVKSIEDNTLRGSGALNPVPVLIKAAAGSGKTWTMWQMMYFISVRKVAPLAIFVQRLANLLRTIPDALAQCQVSFVEFYIRHTVEKASRVQYLLQAFRMRTLVIAVDGIDEAADFKNNILDFIFNQLAAQGHCFVVTSRPEAIDATQDRFQKTFAYMDLKPLDLAQQDFAVQQQLKGNVCYYHLREFSNARTKHDEFYRSMDERARKAVETGLPKPKKIADSDKRYWQKNATGLDVRPMEGPITSNFLSRNREAYLASNELTELAKKVGESDKQKLLDDIYAKCDEIYALAEKALPKIEAGLKTLYRQQGLSVDGSMTFASLKSPIRAMEKAIDDYGGNVARVLDIVRCRIICVDLAMLSRLVIALAKPPFWLQLCRVKNKFDPKELVASHFRTILLNLKAMCCQCGTLRRSFLDDDAHSSSQCCSDPTRTWHMFEVQIHHKTILELDEKLHTHEHYEYLRSLTNVKVSDQLNFLLEKQLSLFAAIAQTPVLLSLLIVVLDRADHKLPTSVYELYEFAIEASLQNWCNQRMQIEEEGWVETIRNVVRLVAYKNHRKKRKEFTGKGINPQLWREICGTGENDCVVLSFIKVISQNYLYQFSHLSFQEFLYLEELQDRARRQLAVPQFSELLADPWYTNALNLTSDDMKLALLQATTLDFDSQLQGSQAAILAAFLKTNATVTSLDIRHNNIKDSATANALCQAVLNHPCLESFSGINIMSLRQAASRSAAPSSADLLSESKEACESAVGMFRTESLAGTLQVANLREKAYTLGNKGITLNLQHNGLGLVEGLVLASILRANETITFLDLADNQLDLEAITALTQALRVNACLKTLDLSSNKLGDAGATAIASTLEVNQTLTSLNLYSNEIETKGATIISEALRSNRALTSLNLDHNNIFAAAGALAEALKVNLGLQKLDISSNGIGDKGATLIARGLKSNTKLLALDMSNNPIGDKGVVDLAACLKGNSTLQVLKLSNIDIKDEGAATLASMIKSNEALLTIVLTSNAITDKGAAAILKTLKANKGVESCQLFDNKISAEVMGEVKAALAENRAFREFQESQGKPIKRKKWPF